MNVYSEFSKIFNIFGDDLLSEADPNTRSPEESQRTLEIMNEVYRQAALVQIIGSRAVAKVAHGMEVPPDEHGAVNKCRNLFILVTRMDTTLNAIEKVRLRADWRKVQKTQWFKDEIDQHPDTPWWTDEPSAEMILPSEP